LPFSARAKTTNAATMVKAVTTDNVSDFFILVLRVNIGETFVLNTQVGQLYTSARTTISPI
jgi:hypothetical protein